MKYIIFLSLFVLTFPIQAMQTCSKNGTTVIYTNGVTTPSKDARRALTQIKSLTSMTDIDLKKINAYQLGYNYEESVSKDFLESAVQRFPVSFLKEYNYANGYAAYMAYRNGSMSSSKYAGALNSIAISIIELNKQWVINYKTNSKYNQTIREIKTLYETALNNGERVFAISHSQGGLFMNDVYQSIQNNDKIKVFSGFQIASPLAEEMDSHFGYATHSKDRLINQIRDSIGAISANINAPEIVKNSTNDPVELYLNHGVRTTYLFDSSIRNQLVNNLKATALLLESNCPIAYIDYTKENLNLYFTATNPDDLDAIYEKYTWSFGDGKVENTTTSSVAHNYATAGNYQVSLTVFDKYGNSDTKTMNINVGTIASGSINFYIANRDVIFDLKPVLNISTPLKYLWNYGDGYQAISAGPTVVHRYNNEGIYTVTVKVYNSDDVLLFANTTFILVDVSQHSMCASTRIWDGLFQPSTLPGFSAQIDLDPVLLGRCFIKNVEVNESTQQTCARLYNCSRDGFIP